MNLRQLRRRLRSVGATREITHAMEMVSASKVRRLQEVLNGIRPYADAIEVITKRLAGGVVKGASFPYHPLLEKRPVQSLYLIIISSDRGLCGSYNVRLFEKAESFLSAVESPSSLICIGKRSVDYFRRRKWQISYASSEGTAKSHLSVAREISNKATDDFLSRRVDEVHLVYTRFHSPARQTPTIEKILPVGAQELGGSTRPPFQHSVSLAASSDSEVPMTQESHLEYIIEPDYATVFKSIIPKYVFTKIGWAVSEAWTSEFFARMIAMRNATENAEDMIEKLTLLRNKIRQASITREITEITTTAEALKV